jgi:hypothetical protein
VRASVRGYGQSPVRLIGRIEMIGRIGLMAPARRKPMPMDTIHGSRTSVLGRTVFGSGGIGGGGLFCGVGGSARVSGEWRGTGGIAQLAEHELCKLGVTGSNPVASTILFRPWGGRGWDAAGARTGV